MDHKAVPPEVSAAFLEATDKQRKLALNRAQGMFWKEAMLDAGYAKGQAEKCDKVITGSHVVQTLMKWYASQAVEKSGLTVDRAIEEMASITLFDPKIIHDDSGNVLPVDQWPETARRAFAGWDSAGKPKFWSKMDAFEKVAKVQAWYAPERHSHGLDDPLTQLLQQISGTALPVVSDDPEAKG